MSAGTGTVELKPCPFCGSQPELMEGHRNHWRVECPRCGVRRATFANGGVEEDKARAIRSWNRRSRPQPTPAGEIVERLRAPLHSYGDNMHTLHREAAALIEQQAATIAELREVLEMTTRCIEIVNKTMAEQGFGQSNSLVAVAQIGRATLERRGQ